MGRSDLDSLARRVSEFVKERSWSRYHNPRDIAIALSVEAAELLEIFQWKGSDGEVDEEELSRVRQETADIVIYALSMANACGFDLHDAVIEKIDMNERKYPAGESPDLFG